MGARQAKHSTEEVCAERKRLMRMSLSERRLYYHCGPDFKPIDDILTWPQYFREHMNSQGRQTFRYPVDQALNKKVCLWQGDITSLEIDGVVNSACDPSKKGEINKLLYERAGEYYQDECVIKGLPEPGQVKVTGGYFTPAKYIVHTVPPKTRTADVLVQCYQNCLETAKGHGIRSLAFPCLGTNKFLGFTKSKAAHIALATVRHWMEDHKDDIDRVVFCVFTDADLDTYRNLLQLYFPLDSAEQREEEEQEQAEERVQEFMLAHHMVRLITGCRPTTGALNSGADTLETGKDIQQWQAENTLPTFQPIRLDRSTDVPLVKILVSMYNHSDLNYHKRPLIQFTGEEGLDLGALAREFFFQNIQALTQGPIITSPAFEGAPGHRLPCASRVHSRTGVFEVVGKIVAHSTLHDGMGLVGLSPALVFLLTHRVKKEEVDVSGVPLHVDDVADAELQTLLKKADNMDRLGESDQQMVKCELRDAMERCNYGFSPINDTTLPAIKQELVLYEVIFKRWDQIEQMRQGMDVVGLYTFLCDNPSTANVCRVFPSVDDAEILPHMIVGKLNPRNSNNRHQGYFRHILDDIHQGNVEDASLADLLTFWTGHPALPEGDLHVVVNEEGKYPAANCCFFKLELPGRTESYDEFKDSFYMALTAGASGFTRA